MKQDKSCRRNLFNSCDYSRIGTIRKLDNGYEFILNKPKEFQDNDLELFINGYIAGNEPYHKPHIHIRNKDWSFHSALRLDKAEYAMHEEKMSLLSEDQIKVINEFLHSLTHRSITNWVWAKSVWCSSNKKQIHKKHCPDYTKLLKK